MIAKRSPSLLAEQPSLDGGGLRLLLLSVGGDESLRGPLPFRLRAVFASLQVLPALRPSPFPLLRGWLLPLRVVALPLRLSLSRVRESANAC